MSEKSFNIENKNQHEVLTNHETNEAINPATHETHSNLNHERVNEAARKVHEESLNNTSESLKNQFNQEVNQSIKAVFTDHASKESVKGAYLSSIRTKLSGPDRNLSKFIHKKPIDKASEAIGKTLIRPSGILVGSIVMLIGSIYYLYLTHSTGFKYNFYVATLLFVGGFIIGVTVEMIYRGFSRKND